MQVTLTATRRRRTPLRDSSRQREPRWTAFPRYMYVMMAPVVPEGSSVCHNTAPDALSYAAGSHAGERADAEVLERPGAVSECLDMDTQLVEERHVKIGEGSALGLPDVPAASDSRGAAADERDRQVVVEMRVAV